ncbi:MAG: (2Fe-2S)-binding protein [Xanthomonadales bacterium]|nr:(2Fe-2S)-binding protein [Xanthomonadales bacterium]
MEFELNVNGQSVKVDAEPDMPLLWALRDLADLTGTKYGCGMAQCGACTVHLNGQPIRSCVFPVSGAVGQSITTIEGAEGGVAGAVRKAWMDLAVAQCGYCQSGQIMSAIALLQSNPKPSDADIDSAMSGVLCRCATYHRIRAAIHAAAASIS